MKGQDRVACQYTLGFLDWSAKCPQTPQKQDEISMNFGNKYPPPLICSVYRSVQIDYRQRLFFLGGGELFSNYRYRIELPEELSGGRGPPQFWKKTLREFGLKFGHPTNSESRPESCSENRVSHKLGRECHSASYSENTLEFQELLREWPFRSKSVYSKLVWFPGFWN